MKKRAILVLSPERKELSWKRNSISAGCGTPVPIRKNTVKNTRSWIRKNTPIPSPMSSKRAARRAGMHISICVQEILDFLKIEPGQTGLDATLGYGGHTRKMLECLDGKGHLYALDVDPIESEKTKKRLLEAGYGPEILTVKLMNFADIDQAAREAGGFDFVLADLGVSSMQIDNPERGFTFKADGPLDLRMNPLKGQSAAERLLEMSREELSGMLLENSDEPYAEEIAAAIVKKLRKGETIGTTFALRDTIGEALSFLPKNDQAEAVKKVCQRTFQALRIDVNRGI